MPRGVLFDMDGTLYDSMPNHADSWLEMVTEQGIAATREEFFLYEGSTGAATVNMLYQRAYGRNATDEEVHRLYERKAEIFRGKPQPGVMPGVRELIAALQSLPEQPVTVLVTGSAQGSLLGRLDEDFPGVFPAERRVTALNVKRGKPYPDPFLQGARLAGAAAEDCWVIENAPLGVESGHRAGCYVVAVCTGPIPMETLSRAGADLVLPSMLDGARAIKHARELKVEN
jgi:HAD superfamily hydrolase (TIGR01509 family)